MTISRRYLPERSTTAKALLVVLGLMSGATTVAATEGGPPQSPGAGEKAIVTDGHVFHDAGQMWNHVTNFGLIGSQPSSPMPYSDAPSARWPGEDGVDYLWSGGLWVGASVLGEHRVTTAQYQIEFWPTAAPDDTIYATAHGASGGNRYPWPAPDDDDDGQEDEDPLNNRDDDGDGAIDEDFAAISDQHFRCVFSDTAAIIGETNPDHAPLGITVTQQSLQWSRPVADDFIGYDYTVTNVGDQVLEEVYLGIFADFDVPASGAGSSSDDRAGSWFGEVTASDGSVVPVAVAYMADNAAIDPVPGYAGFVLCGHQTDPSGQSAPAEVAVRSLQIFSGNQPYDQGGDPSNDAERYDALQREEHDPNTLPSAPDDYRLLMSSGPFASLAPGAAITYQISLVAGADFDGLLSAAAEAVLTYRGRDFDRDGDPANGDEFSVRWLRWEDGPVAVAAAPTVPRLSVSPNPFNPRLEIRYNLSQAGPVRLQVYDLRGRLVRTLLDEMRPAGAGTVLWDGCDQAGRVAASGVYQLQLTAGGQLSARRITLVK